MYPAMGCSSVFPGVGKTLEQPIARYGGGEARERTGGGDDTVWYQNRLPAVPAPTRLSPQSTPYTKRTRPTDGGLVLWGGLPAYGNRPCGRGQGEALASPPSPARPIPYAGLRSRLACARAAGTGHHGGSRGEGGVVLHPPDNASPGGRVRNGPESSSGAKIPPGQPLPSPPTPAVVPGSLSGLRLWSCRTSSRMSMISPPSPPVLVTGGGRGHSSRGGLSRFRGAALCRVLPARARLLW